jgi:hypothetical protein
MTTQKASSGGSGDAAKVGRVWYATKADPLLALKPVLLLESPEGELVTIEPEGAGGSPASVVQAVLGAAGFVGSAGRGLSIKAHEGDPQCIRHYGFEVSAGAWGSVFGAVTALSGDLGGWTSVLVGQTAFHSPSHMNEILSAVWDKAGRPSWCIAHSASMIPARGSGAPMVLTGMTALDLRGRTTDKRFEGLEAGGSDTLTKQRVHLDVPPEVKVAPEKCEHCGGRLYEHEGYYFCATAAETEESPDFEHS